MKKQIEVVIDTCLKDYLDGSSLDEAIKYLNKLKLEHNKGFTNIRISFDQDNDYYGNNWTVVNLKGQRLENDKECKERELKESKDKESCEQYERQHYEILKKKYDKSK